MKTFVDERNRTWEIAIDVDAVRRVRDLCDVDLMDVVSDSGKLLARLDADPVLLCDVICAVCGEQLEAASVSNEDFGKAMAGDAIDRATTAFLEELVGFFPARKRTVFAKAVKTVNEYADLATQRAIQRLDSPEMKRQVEAAIDQAFASPAGSSSPPAPASSA